MSEMKPKLFLAATTFDESIRLVRGMTKGQVEGYLVRDLIDVRRATPEDVEALMAKGIKVESALTVNHKDTEEATPKVDEKPAKGKAEPKVSKEAEAILAGGDDEDEIPE